MLIVVSPAKTLDFETPAIVPAESAPALLDETVVLAATLKKKSPKQLSTLMGISDKLAELNHGRFQDWDEPVHHTDDPTTRPAIYAFRGEVYLGLAAETLTKRQITYAQDHFRILSGFYGVLRPLDRILPYRLEMGSSLKANRKKDLYAFWGSKITEQITQALECSGSKFLLNLASNEYFNSIKKADLDVPVISPTFKDFNKGKYKVLSFFAKKARGTMAAWAIRNKVKSPKKLLTFAEDDYRYDEESSTPEKPVFLRG